MDSIKIHLYTHPVFITNYYGINSSKTSKSDFLERACSNRVTVLLNSGFRLYLLIIII